MWFPSSFRRLVSLGEPSLRRYHAHYADGRAWRPLANRHCSFGGSRGEFFFFWRSFCALHPLRNLTRRVAKCLFSHAPFSPSSSFSSATEPTHRIPWVLSWVPFLAMHFAPFSRSWAGGFWHSASQFAPVSCRQRLHISPLLPLTLAFPPSSAASYPSHSFLSRL